jgi:hypothetical protein
MIRDIIRPQVGSVVRKERDDDVGTVNRQPTERSLKRLRAL